jgi:hypothetical protein
MGCKKSIGSAVARCEHRDFDCEFGRGDVITKPWVYAVYGFSVVVVVAEEVDWICGCFNIGIYL